MIKTISLFVAAVAAGAAGLAGYSTWNNKVHYEQGRAAFIAVVAKEMPDNSVLRCTTSTEWFGVIQNENCNVVTLPDNTVLFAVWQRAIIEPLRVRATFGVDQSAGLMGMTVGLMAPQLLAEQQGSWSVTAGDTNVYYHYQTGPANVSVGPTDSFEMSPLVINGYFDLLAPHVAVSDLSIDKVVFSGLGDASLRIQKLHATARTLIKADMLLTERSDLAIGLVEGAAKGNSLRIIDLETDQASSIENGKMSSAGSISIADVSVSLPDQTFHFENLTTSTFIDQIDVASLQALQESDNPFMDMFALLHKGLALYVDESKANFTLQDRRPGMLGTAGDYHVSGSVKYPPAVAGSVGNPFEILDSIDAAFTISVSQSFRFGPQAGLILEFIEKGWIDSKTDRLLTKIEYKNGEVAINGEPFSGWNMLPTYQEDH